MFQWLDNMYIVAARFLEESGNKDLKDMVAWRYAPMACQRKAITTRMARRRGPMTFQKAFSNAVVSDRFSEAITHWRKLKGRVCRGIGNPCPLLLIGLPDSIVIFYEREAALAEADAAISAEAVDGGRG